MKITTINGQNHKGSSYTMGRMLANKLTDDKSITEFFLPKDLNHFCLGCYSCLEDEAHCPFWQEKQKIISAMEESDLIIFTTPNYCLAPSAPMKTLLDMMFDCWMVHKPKKWMFKKKAVVFSTSAGASCAEVIKVMKKSLNGWGISYVKSYGIPVHAMNWAGVSQKEKEKIGKKLSAMAQSLNKNKEPKVSLAVKANFAFMRMLHIKGWDSSPTEAVYWKQMATIIGSSLWNSSPTEAVYWKQMGWLGKGRPWKN